MKNTFALAVILFLATSCSKKSPDVVVRVDNLSVPTESQNVSSHNFGLIIKGQSVEDKTFTFERSAGSSEPSSSSVSLSNTEDFSIVSATGCNRSLTKSNEKCSVRVRFKKALVIGSYSGTLSVGSETGSFGINLSANVIQDPAQNIGIFESNVQEETIVYGLVNRNTKMTKIIEIRNISDYKTPIPNISVTGDGYSITSSNCHQELNAPGSCFIRLTLSSGPGSNVDISRNGFLIVSGFQFPITTTVRGTDLVSGSSLVKFYENSVLVETMNYGPLSSGSITKIFTLKNEGSLSAQGPGSLSGDSAFSVSSNNCPSSLGPNKSCQVRIRFTHASGQDGSKSASFTLGSSLALSGSFGNNNQTQPAIVNVDFSPLVVRNNTGKLYSINFYNPTEVTYSSNIGSAQFYPTYLFNNIYRLQVLNDVNGNPLYTGFNTPVSTLSSSLLDQVYLTQSRMFQSSSIGDNVNGNVLDSTWGASNMVYFGGNLMIIDTFTESNGEFKISLVNPSLVVVSDFVISTAGSCILDYFAKGSDSTSRGNLWFKYRNNKVYFTYRCGDSGNSRMGVFDGSSLQTFTATPGVGGTEARIGNYEVDSSGNIYYLQADVNPTGGSFYNLSDNLNRAYYLKKRTTGGTTTTITQRVQNMADTQNSAYLREMLVSNGYLVYLHFNGSTPDLLRLELSSGNVSEIANGIFEAVVQRPFGDSRIDVRFIHNPQDPTGFILVDGFSSGGNNYYVGVPGAQLFSGAGSHPGNGTIMYAGSRYVFPLTSTVDTGSFTIVSTVPSLNSRLVNVTKASLGYGSNSVSFGAPVKDRGRQLQWAIFGGDVYLPMTVSAVPNVAWKRSSLIKISLASPTQSEIVVHDFDPAQSQDVGTFFPAAQGIYSSIKEYSYPTIDGNLFPVDISKFMLTTAAGSSTLLDIRSQIAGSQTFALMDPREAVEGHMFFDALLYNLQLTSTGSTRFTDLYQLLLTHPNP